ncbi:MAG TPA: tetratricopeptide repeat protein, partial [Limnochordia bacterium]|nr:tetratricopeptide repeat protein [Limnochordia bacterium]
MLRVIAVVAALISLTPTARAAAVDFAPQNFHPWPESGAEKLAGAYFHDAPAALDDFAAAAKANPNALDAAADYAALQRQLGFAAASVHTFRQLAASQPDEPRWRRELGWAEYEAGDPAAARSDFAAALAAAPGDAWSLMGAGLTDYALGRTDEAADKLQAAVDADARLGLAYKILGELAEADGDAPAAIAHYRRALSQDGSYVSLYFEIFKLEERSGDYAAALRDLNVAVRISPRDPEVSAAAASFKKAHSDLVAATKARLESRPAPIPPKVAPAPKAPYNPLIRVGVEQGRKEQRIVCGGGFTVRADGVSAQGVGGFSYRLVATDGGVTVEDSNGQPLLAAKGPLELTPL